MKKIILYFLCMIPILLAGQTGVADYYNSDSLVISEDSPDFNEKEMESYLKEKKMNFRFNAGAFAGTSFGSGEYFGTYVSPQINYRLSPKFTVTGGATIVKSYGSLYSYPSNDESFGYPSANFTRTFLYASGAYQLSERLIISGTVYKEFNVFDQQSTYSKNNASDYQGMIMGVDYKIGKNIFIQGQIEISNNPYSRHGYPNSSFGNGFGNSSFNHYPPF